MKGQKQTQLSCNTASKCHRQFETVLQVRTDFSQENFGTSNKLTEIFTCTSTIQVACDSLIQHDKCWEILQKLCFKTLENHYDVSQTQSNCSINVVQSNLYGTDARGRELSVCTTEESTLQYESLRKGVPEILECHEKHRVQNANNKVVLS